MSHPDPYHAIRVVLADDHPVILEALRTRIAREEDIEIVGEARSGAQALRMVERRKPNVLVLDMQLPDMNGVDVVKAIERAGAAVYILVWSAFADAKYVLRLIKETDRPVPAYLTKDEHSDKVLDTIRDIARGKVGIYSPGVVEILLHRFKNGPHLLDALSQRQRQVLFLLPEGKTNKEIAAVLGIAVNTVKRHLSNAYKTLGVKSRTEAVDLIWRNGLR
jgi:DNA-binding NarL/FixJ family response regulator